MKQESQASGEPLWSTHFCQENLSDLSFQCGFLSRVLSIRRPNRYFRLIFFDPAIAMRASKAASPTTPEAGTP